MDWDRKYMIHPKNIKLKRDERVLYFFPDSPYWTVTNSDGEQFLDSLDGKKTLREIIEPSPMVEEFLNPFVEAEAVITEDELDSIMQPKQFDISSVKPGQVNINVTNRCNLQCKHCFVNGNNPEGNPEMSTESIKKVIEELNHIMDEKRRILDFIGGEPTLRPDLVELLKYACERNFLVLMPTNATKITPQLAKELSSLDVRIQVSLDGADRETHEFMRGNGTWDLTMKGLHILLDNGVRPTINMVYHQGNIEQIPLFIDLAKSLNIQGRFIPLVEIGKARNSSVLYVGLDKMVDIVSQKIKADPGCIDYIRSSYFTQLINTIRYSQHCKYCGSGLYTITIDANGDVYPCLNTMTSELKAGNILDTPLSNIFQSSLVFHKMREINVEHINQPCSACDYKYLCGSGCRGEAFQATGDLYAPDIHCASWRKAIEKLFWLLAEMPSLMELPIDDRLPQLTLHR